MNKTTELEVIPALGLTWSNQITCRVMLSRPKLSTASLENINPPEVTFEPTYRKLKVVFAPHIPQNEIIVYIDPNGIHGAPI
ncbi:unnamed protein product [Lymnaea stagnalis]|uniref:Uncharacterized protein n=1 Tax=Lymnaea stagnalis TaxID=6523 RepID=A0AAV2HS16_LYMST